MGRTSAFVESRIARYVGSWVMGFPSCVPARVFVGELRVKLLCALGEGGTSPVVAVALLEHCTLGCGALLTRPLVYILEEMPVDCLHVVVIEVALDGVRGELYEADRGKCFFPPGKLEGVGNAVGLIRAGEFVPQHGCSWDEVVIPGPGARRGHASK